MSRLDELIAELCPDGVEYKELMEICHYRRGSFPQPYGNAAWYGGELAMPFVQVADIEENKFTLVDKTKQTISQLAQPKSVFVKHGTVIVSIQGTIGRVAITQYDSYVDRTIAIFDNFNIQVNKKYFAYQLKKKFDIEKKFARGSTLKTITKEEFSKFKIPIPPLPVQNEIVRILDNFAELTAKLTAELTARRKQYEYYRDLLLTFNESTGDNHLTDRQTDSVKWARLGNIAIISRGVRLVRNQLDIEGLYPVFQNSMTPLGYYEKSNCKANTTFIIAAGAAGEIGYSYIDFWAADDCYYLTCQENLNNRYVYYALLCQSKYIKSKVRRASVPRLGRSDVENIKIPIPSIKKQKRIASILDRFDALCNDITAGLPAEIEARRKQYEYYRDKLLSFKEKSA